MHIFGFLISQQLSQNEQLTKTFEKLKKNDELFHAYAPIIPLLTIPNAHSHILYGYINNLIKSLLQLGN